MDYRSNLKEKKFSIFMCRPTSTEEHSHNFLELAYVVKGKATHIWDKNRTQIYEGCYFVIDYPSKHSYVSKSPDFELINCLFLPELIDPALANCHSFTSLIGSYQIHFNNEFFAANPSANIYRDDDKKVQSILLAMLQEFTDENSGYLQIIRSKIIELLVITMRKIYLEPVPLNNDKLINEILRYINSEYMSDITLSDICIKFGYSFTYLSAKFKKETGINFTQYLQKTRIEQSMRLLVHTNKSIIEITNDVGYRDIKSYYAAFKRIANTTPAKFRKNHFSNI